MNYSDHDYSTIDLDRLAKLPSYTTEQIAAKGWHIDQDSIGAGCFMDAPGFPSHFVQSVYNGRGDTPRNGPEYVIRHPGTGAFHVVRSDDYSGRDWDQHHARYERRLRRLWLPLPLESERVQGWVRRCYTYFGNCWVDWNMGAGARRVDTLVKSSFAQGEESELFVYRPLDAVREYYPGFTGTLADGSLARLSRLPRAGDWIDTMATAPLGEAECARTMPRHLKGSHGGPLLGYKPQGAYGATVRTMTIIGTSGCHWCGLAAVVDHPDACARHSVLGCNVCDGTVKQFVARA